MNDVEMKSEKLEGNRAKDFNKLHDSQRWEDVELSECNIDSLPDTQQLSQNIDCDSVTTMKDATINWAKESAQQVLDASPDFITNITFTSTVTLLLYLVLRNNGLTTENLQSFLNLSYIWLSSIVGGYLIRLLRLPPLLGMITAAATVSNWSDDINIPDRLGETISSSGLAIILLLSGLELDTKSLTRSSGIALRLTCIPGVVEAFTSGLMAMIIFGMPFWLGLSMGFILAAVSPALVVVGMLKLQHSGYGIKKGIPSLIVAAASMDDIVAITGFSFFIGLAIQSGETNVLFSAIHGPLSIILGVAIGGICGMILSFTKVLNKSWKRTVIAILLVLCQMFLLKKLSYAGAGALGSLITGIVASHSWENGTPRRFSLEANQKFTETAEAQVSVLWSLIFEPLLFGFIGSSLDFELLGQSFSKSFGILITGIVFRLTAAYFATSGGETPMNTKERLFISLVWMPKATVQAVLCSFPLMLAKDVFSPDSEDYDKYVLWGNQIMSTAILSILITAPLGLAFIQCLGPRWLSKDKDDASQGKAEVQSNGGKTPDEESDENISTHVGKIDELVRQISLSSNQVETSCILAELRQTLWKCKSILRMKGKKDTT